MTSRERVLAALAHRQPDCVPVDFGTVVAEAVALLITNDYITGEVIVVDGGLTMKIP